MFKVQSVADFEHPIDAMLECIDICINKFSHVGKIIEDILKNHNGDKGSKKESKDKDKDKDKESKDIEKKPKKIKK
jgi:hypothetical protein